MPAAPSAGPFAPFRVRIMVDDSFGPARRYPHPRTIPAASGLPYFLNCFQRQCDESNSKNRAGRQALAVRGWLSLGAVPVSGSRSLSLACHISSSSVACVWLSGSVSSAYSVVAAVCLVLALSHWLAGSRVVRCASAPQPPTRRQRQASLAPRFQISDLKSTRRQQRSPPDNPARTFA